MIYINHFKCVSRSAVVILLLQERVIWEHFLRQTPRLMLHAASDSSLTLVLDVPDLSLLDGKVRET
jgi:hypothetical protein